MDTAGGLGGDQGLEMDLIDNEGLNNLGLNDRGGNFKDRLILKKEPPLGDGPDFASESHPFEEIEKFIGKDPLRMEVVYGPLVEAKIREEIQYVF